MQPGRLGGPPDSTAALAPMQQWLCSRPTARPLPERCLCPGPWPPELQKGLHGAGEGEGLWSTSSSVVPQSSTPADQQNQVLVSILNKQNLV